MNEKILVAAFLVLFTFQVSGFDASIEPVKPEAEADSPAEFQLNIENTESADKTYSISLLSPKSSWFYYPGTVRADANSNQTATITVSPTEKAVQQRYRFDMKVRQTDTGETKELTGFFNVKQPYILHIIDLNQDKEEVNPGESFNTQIEVQNLDSQSISDYEVRAEYRNQTRTGSGTEILSKGTRRFNFTFQTSKNAKPSTEQIQYTVTADNETQSTTQQKITINTVENLEKTSQTQNRLIEVQETVKAVNNGNTRVNTTVQTEIPSYLSSITETYPEPSNITERDGKIVYTWQTELEPGESFSASYKTKYWVLIAALTLIALGITVIKLLTNDINIRKNTSREGEKVKIDIEIENDGQKTFEKLHLEEFIPDIASVDETFDMNTPKIRKTNEGTKLNWEIQDLTPGDQRIIQYRIKPKVQVEGTVKLQKAVLKNSDGETIRESKETTTEFQPDTN